MNADNKLLETVFVIVICCLSDYKQQSKILLLTIFIKRSLIALTISIAAYLVCFWYTEDASQNNLIQGLGVISCFCWKKYFVSLHVSWW